MTPKKEYKDFESAMARLEEIVMLLEAGESSLEESIALYTEGIKIAEFCNNKLNNAEGQIARLSKLAENFKLEKFNSDRHEDE
jgi:exodeoxyribonuclease VII small subunit